MDIDFAPPKHSAEYEAKPLPAIPPRSSFSIPDLKNPFKTPKRNLENKQYVYDWDGQGDDTPVIADSRNGTPRSRSLPENDANSIPTVPSNEILSPQPRHSRQKILRLTGNISPSMNLASFTPGLHNSPQKIKQLTGLDVGSSSPSESHSRALQHSFQDEVSPVSPSSSTYSTEGLEATISEPDSDASEYSLHSDPNGVTTALTAPTFNNASSRPSSTAPVSPTTKLRLSSFALREPDTCSPRGSLADFKAHYRHGSTAGSWASSRKSSATVVPHYASGSDTTKCSPRTSENMANADMDPSSPSFKQRSLIWDTSPVEILTADGQDQASPSSSPPPTPFSSASVGQKPGSLSERRASSRSRVPTPLEPLNRESPKPGKFGLPQRTPYPPPSSTRSAFDSDEDSGGKRTSILAKVFGGGSGSSSKRQSRGPTPSASPSPFGGGHRSPASSAKGGPPLPPPPEPSRSPIDPIAAAAAGGRPLSAGAGLFQRARQSVGLRSRADRRRETLRGKIRVVET
ncbi:hypothetical protein Daus18300_008858 [Diaporthe australafricana]|uniref:Uncharacterized protein n=1 Tax=Diaporthe australafricana TaxID=127596 RepID=A0ABR3WGN4_9PEZI